MPKISVIMPVYNGIRFIAKTINSVLAQEFQDWELIIVDDGSTDGTAKLLADVTDARIHVITQANGGASSARNRGLEAVKGAYVGFLDADDLYLPNALADMATFLEDHKEFDAVRCDGYFCDANDQPLGRISEVRPEVPSGHILEELVVNPAVVGPPLLVMVRHACLLKAGIRFDTQLAPSEDWDFWIELARHAQFGFLDTLTCMYRIHETNITKTTDAQRRNVDLVRGRLKIMNADWFAELSLPTRKVFFYNLLVGLLGNQPEQQHTVIEAASFKALPPGIKADLLRQMAGNHLSGRQNSTFALDCLRRSVGLQPANLKGRVLMMLARGSPALAAAVLATWQIVHRTAVGVSSLGQRKPKPVPAALMPKTE